MLGLVLKKINVKRHGQLGIEQWPRQESGSKVTEQPSKETMSTIHMHYTSMLSSNHLNMKKAQTMRD